MGYDWLLILAGYYINYNSLTLKKAEFVNVEKKKS